MDNRTALSLLFQAFRKRFDFHGRARRAELLLYYFLVYIVGHVGLALHPMGWSPTVDFPNQISVEDFKNLILSLQFGGGVYTTVHFLVSLAVGLVLFVPIPALLVRRLHDMNASGWWSLPVVLSFFVFYGITIALFVDFHFRPVDFHTGLLIAGGAVFLAGLATLIAAMCLKGNRKQNRYGPDPLKDDGAGSKAAKTSGGLSGRSRKSGPTEFTNAMAMKLMFQPFRRYFDFSGRARRAEFWLFQFFCVAVSVVVGAIDPSGWSHPPQLEILATGPDIGAPVAVSFNLGVFSIFLSIAMSLFGLAVLMPAISVSVRRLHDRDLTGWWIASPFALFLLLPFLGVGIFLEFMTGLLIAAIIIAAIAMIVVAITLFVFFCLKGTNGRNRYGPDPLQGDGIAGAAIAGSRRVSRRSRGR